MKKIIQYIKKCFVDIRENRLLVGLIVTGVLNDITLRTLTVGGFFKLKPLLTSIGVILIFSLIAVLLSNKKRNYMYLIFSGLFALLNAANYLYYRHFNSFISVGILSQSKHLNDLKSGVIETLNLKFLLFVIPTLTFIWLYRKSKNEFRLTYSDKSVNNNLKGPLIIGLILLISVSTTLTSTDFSRLTKQWNREYLVEQFGIYTFSIADFVKAATVPRAIKADSGNYDEMLKNLVKNNNEANINNKFTNVLEGKDLYIIHYESAQNFAMDLSFEDGEVTPFLNELSKESLFFNNFYPQHSVGTSSDSEFTFSTSLYPINNRTVFIDHADKEFESIQKLLTNKGYHTMSMHGNDASFWNRNIMYPQLGYNEFISKEDYLIDEVVGLGLSDKSFYKQSVKMIQDRKKDGKPLMAKLISLSHHYPFDDLDVYGDFDTGHLEKTEISNYLKSLNYADKALQQFFEDMDKQGLFENAAVILYGDHHAKISNEDYELLYNYNEKKDTYKNKLDDDYIKVNNAYLKQLRKTPLMIWTKDDSLNEVHEEPVGMIDVMPTLANMLNINNKFGFGKDIFNKSDDTIIFPDGSFLTKDFYYSSTNLETYSMQTNELILEENLKQEFVDKIMEVEKELEISSELIENDLITYYKEYLE